MNRKTKDLILIYICFALFAASLIIWGITLKSRKDKMAQPQEVIQEQQAEVPIVYDRPMENPAAQVEAIQQLPEFPSGDEFAAAASFLNAYGYDAMIEDLIPCMNYSEDNFVEAYVGDATTNTGYCFSGSLVICMNNYLAPQNTPLRTINQSGISWEDFKNYINSGQPMIVWFTNDYNLPRFTDITCNNYYTMYENAHCVVVYGIENGIVAFADSLNENNGGKVGIPEDEFRQIWEACGSQCIGTFCVNR